MGATEGCAAPVIAFAPAMTSHLQENKMSHLPLNAITALPALPRPVSWRHALRVRGVLFAGFLLAGLGMAAVPLAVHANPASASEAKMTVATAVNMAGRQRMLSQRMVKAYLMLGQGIAPNDAQRILQQSVDLFESQLVTLKTFQPNPKVQAALAHLDAEWRKIKPVIGAPPSEEGALLLYPASEALQAVAHTVTLAYAQGSAEVADRLVNLAGRQRMLSQRAAKFYLYGAWNLNSKPADMEMHFSRAHFTAVLIQLEGSPHATAPVKALIERIRREWEPYRQVLLESKEPAKMRSNGPRVAELSEQLLASTEELVTLILAPTQKP